jgi:tRNA threonylcarbamoyl adenosine modification protein YeaZ
MHNIREQLILSLEPGLDGGTVSILKNGEQIDCVKGSGKVSKSEDLLLLLDNLLKKNQIRKSAIKLIVVSEAPGSLTGIRIGLAFAKGLSAAFGIKVEKSSVLDALARLSGDCDNLWVAIATQSSGIYLRRYTKKGGLDYFAGEIRHCRELDEFIDLMLASVDDFDWLVVNRELYEALSVRNVFKERIQEKRIKLISGNFAEMLGKLIHKNASDNIIAKKNDAFN